MAGTKFKWKFTVFFYLLLVNVCTKSLPISTIPSLTTSDTVFKYSNLPDIQNAVNDLKSAAEIIEHEDAIPRTNLQTIDNSTEVTDRNFTEILHKTRSGLLRNIRPGQEVHQYALELTVNGNTFTGRAVIDVVLEFATREDPIELHVEGLQIISVMAGVITDTNAVAAGFNEDEGILNIEPAIVASSHTLIIEYTGSLTTAGQGFYRGEFNDMNYVAMNLHPTNARRVFPCVDEPTVAANITFTFNGIEYNHLMSNTMLVENSENQFRALRGPPHLWSMVAHNLNSINIQASSSVFLYIRPGVNNQNTLTSLALNAYYNDLNEWTLKPYFEIIDNQASQLSILALPDVSRDWYGLSTVAIWEPHILMESTCSAKQTYTALSKMAEALSRQWFGQAIYPENWRYEWVVSGLATYAAFDILRDFQTNPSGEDDTLLDINTLFVTEIIQESLYYDGYTSALALETGGDDLFEEDEIRDYIYGIHKYKAPALFRMFRIVLGNEQDFIRQAGRALLTGSGTFRTVNVLNFVDAINSDWIQNGNGAVGDIAEYLEPWLETNGCPLVTVTWTPTGVLVVMERFAFVTPASISYTLPITYSVSNNHNFDSIQPVDLLEGVAKTYDMFLDLEEGDYVLFNVQGQGYYRVNYADALWENIIEALDDPVLRAEIHPLNRATLIDDALNLARAGRIDYEIAFQVVLTMEHETEYAPWKAFVRNMNFLRKRLVAMVSDDEDLDPDIYLRMVRRTIRSFENGIGFSPDPQVTEPVMTSLTRGLVMDHACRAGYQPCIAAAVDWFYDSNNVVNPNIPSDIRPAVYCTMVREGGDDIINALYDRLDIEVSMWERVVILESLACSTNEVFVRTYLEETIATNSQYTTEERVKIFKAVAESSWENAFIAMNFMTMRVNEIRNIYGGPAKLEEVISALGENMADWEQSNNQFNVWVYAQNNNLDDSQFPAERIAARVMEDAQWNTRFGDYVYEWIDENDAPTLVVSLVLISISGIIALLNH